jgi:dCTP deaminase
MDSLAVGPGVRSSRATSEFPSWRRTRVMLSDQSIIDALLRQELNIDPFPGAQPASVDVHLNRYYARTRFQPFGFVRDLRKPAEDLWDQREDDRFVILPGELMLATLEERICLGPGIAAQVAGKSSLGREGLMIHVTAGFVDPGWDGYLTLELYNCAPWPIQLEAGMPIGQVTFYRLETPCGTQYGDPSLGSKHLGLDNQRPMISKFHKNFKEQ